MLCASSLTFAENWAAAVSRTTCRIRGSAAGAIALRLTITTSAQDGSAASARTTAAPTCPVPPMIKTRNAIRSFPALLYLHSDGPDDQAEAFDIGCDQPPQHFREGPFPGALQQLNFLSSGRETSVKPCLLRLVPKGSFHQLFLIGSWYHD